MRSPERPFVPRQECLEALPGGLLAKEERVGDMAGTDEDTAEARSSSALASHSEIPWQGLHRVS